MNDSEKAHIAKRCLAAFASKFGERDVYTNLVLEVIFEELYGRKSKKTVSVPVETRQEGNESFEHFPLQALPSDQNYRLVKPKTSRISEKLDPEDHT